MSLIWNTMTKKIKNRIKSENMVGVYYVEKQRIFGVKNYNFQYVVQMIILIYLKITILLIVI